MGDGDPGATMPIDQIRLPFDGAARSIRPRLEPVI